MAHKITIQGREIEIEWTQQSARQVRFRLADHGGFPKTNDFSNASKADIAVSKVAWALLPDAEIANYPTPEQFYIALEENDAKSVAEGVFAIFAEMNSTAEKKSNGKK